MKTVLVIGSLNMDYTIYVDNFPKEGETILGNARFIQPGGKGANQAAAIAKSGLVKCVFLGARGNDSDGDIVEKTLSEIGVNSKLKISEKSTGNATILVDKSSENKIIIIPGANHDLEPKDIDIKLIEESDFVVLQNEIKEETNSFVMKKAKELGKVVIYNPAPFRKLTENVFEYVDYFMPNKIELSQYSNKSSVEEGAKEMLKLGVKNLIVTLGTEGSILFNNKEKIVVNAYKVRAIDTVAAGDTYVGYFVSALASGNNVMTSMKIASKASSITVTRKGSLVSIPIGSEIKIN